MDPSSVRALLQHVTEQAGPHQVEVWHGRAGRGSGQFVRLTSEVLTLKDAATRVVYDFDLATVRLVAVSSPGGRREFGSAGQGTDSTT